MESIFDMKMVPEKKVQSWRRFELRILFISKNMADEVGSGLQPDFQENSGGQDS